MKQKVVCSLLPFLILAFLFLLLHEPFYYWWCGTGIGLLFGGVDSTAINDGLSLALAVIGSMLMCLLPKSLSKTGNRWGRIICGGLIFILLVESFAFNNNFIHFKTIPWLRYTDILVLVLVVFILASCLAALNRGFERDKVQNGGKEKSEILRFDDTDEEDFLGRSQLVSNIRKCITEDKGNARGATGVAITGGWGTGKSWLLSKLKSSLEQDNEICLNFSPWLYGETDIARQYYKMLERGLKLHGVETEDLKRAVAEIDNDQLHGFGRFILSVFGIAMNGQGRENTVGQIKTNLEQTGRKVFVFIDDCDRLAKTELMQVLSLIRNTGDFPYLTYIMAFDKKVVGNIIGEDVGMNYVAKMFNLTIDLPPVSDVVMADYLKMSTYRILGTDALEPNPFTKVQITKLLPTVREAKKYLNLLHSDYKRLEERLNAHLYNEGDLCLVELLKYKFPKDYYQLQSAPETYISYEIEGWNSPVGVLKKDVVEGNERPLIIFKALFKNDDNKFADDHTLSIAGKEYFPMYFEKELNGKYVDKETIGKAVVEGKLPERLGEWVDEGLQGVLSVFCTINGVLSKKDIYSSFISYIWHMCEKQEHILTLGDLTFGYDRLQYKHSFTNIMKFIAASPQFGLMSFQHISTYEKEGQSQEDAVDVLIQESQYPLELMGIWMSELNKIYNDDYPYSEVRAYVLELWQKLINMAHKDNSLTVNIIDILGACTLEDTFQNMVLPLVIENPKRWLGATVMTLKDGDKVYYMLKNRGIHALFGSLEAMDKEMDEICASAHDADKEYVNEYKKLIHNLEAMSVNRNESSISVIFKDPARLKIDYYPTLKESIIIGKGPVMPVKEALRKIQNKPFWKGEDLRIRRRDPGYYFDTEI